MSQNGAFNGAPPWREGARRLRHGNAYPDGPDPVEVAKLNRAASVQPASDGLTRMWKGMDWDPALMCWTDDESLNAMARVVETYPVRTAKELALVRDRELEAG